MTADRPPGVLVGRPRWEPVAASWTGARHLSRGVGNQDAYAYEVTAEHQVVVVADGHGADEHPRSDVGAQLAADIAARTLLHVAHERPEGFESLDNDLARVAAPRFIDAWRRAVLEHARAWSWSAAEAKVLGPRGLDAGDVLYAYGTTVVALLATRGALGAFQIGDGDVVFALSDGSALRPLPDDPDAIGSQTASVAQSNAASSARVAAVDLRATPVELAWVSTDGFGSARSDPRGWWESVARQLVQHQREGGVNFLREMLHTWLKEPALAGGDDTTVAMLVSCHNAI